ncbi:holo-[acyl-carrier protein] synthase [Salisediminibacterium halotolerans]|uniref:Holo-[acyl-carrier-protein] synthase n=2 Tax=Salisediminibacterium halotolerans TaxID=517425 RepID=A0A1H9SPC9_9BACI|nr:holo-[acyl-carrier protein] synthase [Salisediminibacterium haloalkalitolerans]
MQGVVIMIAGIGLDIVELARIEHLFTRKPGFAKRILTNSEQTTFDRLHGKRQIEFLAGRYAAKEAYAKAKGCGIGGALSFQDLEVGNSAGGRPVITDFKAAEDGQVHLSITHTRTTAAAQVVLEKQG